jgi:hypothetical protein
MSPEPCTRVREALAAGNVWGDAALLEHARGCQVCTGELAVLKKRREFRDAFPVLSSIADEGGRPAAGAGSGAGAFPRRHLLIMVAALVVIVGYLTRNIATAPSAEENRDGHATSGPPRYKISNLENALFESKVEGPVVRASISRGVAAFYIERITPPQRFVLTLPDGDLEVRGTRFVVSVEDGKTAVVDVAQGTVTLHLQGKPEMILEAGQRWPAASTGRPSLSFMRPPGPKDAGATDGATLNE